MAAGDGSQLPATIAASRSVEKALEEAASSGALSLSNRKLKEFPCSAKNYDLSDITHADLSKNRLCELPEELCQFISLETLSLYHNCIRSIPPTICHLQALTYLNISRNQLSCLPIAVCQLPLLRVLIVSNNKLSALPSAINKLAHLRQLDVSCNELQGLPVEVGQLEALRDLNLRRNQLTTLPEELSELPLVRLDVSCNRVSRVPVCYRHLRHLQTITLDNNPLLSPPAQICSKGKFHIFKFLNIEACKTTQEALERALRPTGFNSCLSDQELFSGRQYGGLDSGFNSVDSGSKRWSGNESADDFSELSLKMAEISKDQRNLQEEGEKDSMSERVNGVVGSVDFTDRSRTEEETKPPSFFSAVSSQEKIEAFASISDSSANIRSGVSGAVVEMGVSPTPSTQSPEERRRPGTLQIWQERERAQQQREKARENSLLKPVVKTGSLAASGPAQTGSTGGGSPESGSSFSGIRQRCASAQNADQMSSFQSQALQRSASRPEAPVSPKASSPTGTTQKPSSFLFRATSRCNVKTSGSVQCLTDSGHSDSRPSLRSPREERQDVIQLRKTLESRLKITLPEDLGEALSNGTILCQLANHIRPRAVSIIHIPSPAVPKLSAAKCRLNVENFLAACRKLGVPEESLCPSQLILEDEGLTRIAQTIQALVELPVAGPRRSSRQDSSTMPLQSTDQSSNSSAQNEILKG
ncbi:leucine-rich repeat and calponin homology domain-containing protein 4 isoform X2 [Scleropages formosus]|uniref:Leucine-rich repeats and calponin homology (CH) domain containing 4 n=1 Tax=Scleropages formosus TaxID=113540 RepID=A0A8C9S5E6_SCLFO|nr:leucine-rich repeat and calponin homology domain-containing protein 4 isoform X2 [Scleropages formosus]XP_029113132.1 leucine-rich repeat and calponin homology domain-containing protein 4 isoform X2 [Scleropages formosus]